MNGVLTALLAGIVVGAIFGALRLMPPAPGTWAGVAGIVGIVAGWQALTYLMGQP